MSASAQAIAASSVQAPVVSVAAARSRALDALRLLAMIQMVQGHTIDAVLSNAHRIGPLHAVWQNARGLTSVAFLFLAGVGHAFATRTEKGRSAPARARRMRRACMLIAVGYAMRAPVFTWLGASAWATSIERAFVVDVLQCIGVTLLVLEGLLLALPHDAIRRGVTAALALVLYALAPALATFDPSGALRPLWMYVTPVGGSLFPLVPWAAHALLGCALGAIFFRPEGRMRLLLALGIPASALGPLLAAALHPTLGHIGRLGVVLLVSAGLLRVEGLLARLPGWAMRVAQQSLLVYLVHVVLAYGTGFGLRDVVGKSLGPLPAVLIALAMLVLCTGLSLAFDRWERRRA